MHIRLLANSLVTSIVLSSGCEAPLDVRENDPPTEAIEVVVAPVALPTGDPSSETAQTIIRYPNHGEEKELGMAKFGGAMVNVTQYGRILEGGEGHFLIDTGRTKVDGVYVWIGLEEDGKKRRWPATPEPNGFHVHCAVPRPLSDEHALWVEIRLPSGKRYHRDYYIGER